jgi:hypothetical protein
MNKTKTTLLARLAALAALLLAGCGTLETRHVLTGPPGQPRGDVRIVLQGQPTPPGLQEVAIVQAVGTGMYARLENVIGGLTTEAGSLGCSAVVNVKIDQGNTTASGTGTCVREASGWNGPPPPPPPPPVAAAPALAR